MIHRVTEEEFKGMQAKVRGTAGASLPCAAKAACEGMTTHRSSSPYKSKWEAAYAAKLDLEKAAGVIKAWKYEGLTFALAKGKYHRIDFLVWHLDGSIEIAQVKGWHKNLRAGMTGLKWAAQLNPWFVWTLKRWTGRGWDSSYVEV